MVCGGAGNVRILLLVFNTTGKGTYWRALDFGRELARRGHAVTLLATSPSARLRVRVQSVEGMTLVEMPDALGGTLRSGWDVWNTLRRMAWIGRQQFDVVHGFESRPTVIFPALWAKRNGAKLVLDWCDWFGAGGAVEVRPNPLVRAVLRRVETFFETHYRLRADGHTAINTLLRARLLAMGAAPARVLLLRNAAPVWAAPLTVESARAQVNLPEGFWVGYVGGAYTADAQLMAQALNALRRSLPGARLLLAGYFNREIEQWLDEPAAVLRTGALTESQVRMYLAACDVCWLPLTDSGANRGRLPYKLGDYLAAGRAVVAADVGDVGLLVREYGAGVVTAANADALAAGVLQLAHAPDLRVQLGVNARRAAESALAVEKLTDDLEKLYESL